MALQFVLGRAGTGKTTTVRDHILDKLAADPQGDPILYLVPEHMSIQTEYNLLSQPQVAGTTRCLITSFARLANQVKQEIGGRNLEPLDSVGMRIILRNIMESHKGKWSAFGQSLDNEGFYQEMESLWSEWNAHLIDPDQLQAALSFFENQEDDPQLSYLHRKLRDIQFLYAQFYKAIDGKYTTHFQTLHHLAQTITHSERLRRSEVFIDGFDQFTPVERLILLELMKHAKQVTLALTLDPKDVDGCKSEMSVFQVTRETYQQLMRAAQGASVALKPAILLHQSKRYGMDSAISHVEQNFSDYLYQEKQEFTGVSMIQAVNRRVEVESAARRMIQLAREEDYRWSDMGLFLRDPSLYTDLIRSVFQEYEIPVYIPERKPMAHHPFIEFIRSSLEIIESNWDTDAVLRAAKTDLLFGSSQPESWEILREEVDRLENYVLATGKQGRDWIVEEDWLVLQSSLEKEGEQKEADLYRQQTLNETKKMIVQPIRKLEASLRSSATMQEMCSGLYHFLLDLNVPYKLEYWDKQTSRKQQNDHEQAWRSFIRLLDKLVELVGAQPASLHRFIQYLEAGMSSFQFSQAPPAPDQVIVSAITQNRTNEIKCAFLLGANEGLLPSKPKKETILSEQERGALIHQGLEIQNPSRHYLLERYFIYHSLAKAADRLWISYSLADAEGKGLESSELVAYIRKLFPGLKENVVTNEPALIDQEILSLPEPAFSALSTQLRKGLEGKELEPIWMDLYNWFIRQEPYKDLLQKWFAYSNSTDSLKDLAKDLYGETIRMSVSRLEKQARCPFSHFAAYGLRLKERDVCKLEAPDIGNVFHAALKMVHDTLTREGRSWADLTREECKALSAGTLSTLADRLLSKILLSSKRHEYIKSKIQEIVERTLFVLSEQARVSDFQPIGFEVGFGRGMDIPPLSFRVNGITIELFGRIDRIDAYECNEQLYLRIIDFKSSPKSIDMAEVYHGISLQLLTYLDMAVSQSESWLNKQASPAGALYFHVHNPMLSEAMRQSDTEGKVLKKFAKSGFVLQDVDIAERMGKNLDSRGYSQTLKGIQITKSGFSKRSKVIASHEFDAMSRHVKAMIQALSKEITEGHIDIHPYKLKANSACTYCSYRPVCQFDKDLPTNKEHVLPPLDRELALEKIMAMGGIQNDRPTE